MIKQLLAILLLAAPASVNPPPMGQNDLPAQLSSWVNWVNHNNPTRFCVSGSLNEEQCLLYNKLNMEITASGASFELSGQNRALKALAVQLPGSEDSAVMAISNKNYPLTASDSLYYTVVPSGPFSIKGQLSWSELPRQLKLPTEIAVVNITYQGEKIFPAADKPGLVVLRKQAKPTVLQTNVEESSTARLQVVTKIQDDRPVMVESRYSYNCPKKDMAVDIPLLPGLLIEKVDYKGQISVEDDHWTYHCPQGRSQLTILGRLPLGADSVKALNSFDKQLVIQSQIVAFVPTSKLWTTELTPQNNAMQIEAKDIDNLPKYWLTNLSSVWKFSPNSVLSWTKKLYNTDSPEKAHIRLNRSYSMIDLSSKDALYLSDNLHITYNQLSQLAITDTTIKVQGVKQDQSSQLLFADSKNRPILLLDNKDNDLNVVSLMDYPDFDSAWPNVVSLPVSSYDQPAQEGSVSLNLFPGWVPLLAWNGQDIDGDYWHLLSLYCLLLGVLTYVMVYLSSWRIKKSGLRILFSISGAMVTILNPWVEDYFEIGWWFVVLVLVTIISLLGKLAENHPRLCRYGRISCGVICAICTISLCSDLPKLVLYAIHPELEYHISRNNRSSYSKRAVPERKVDMGGKLAKSAPRAMMAVGNSARNADQAVMVEPPMPAPMVEEAMEDNAFAAETADGNGAAMLMAVMPEDKPHVGEKRVAPIGLSAPVVANGNKVTMTFSSPLKDGKNFKIFLIPPFWRGAAILLYILMFIITMLSMLGLKLSSVIDKKKSALLLLLAITFGAGPASAQEFPDQQWLADLEKQTSPVVCSGNCQYLKDLVITVENNGSFTMTMVANSSTADLLPLPGPANIWILSDLKVNGQPAASVRKSAYNYVMVPAGQSQLAMSGYLLLDHNPTLSLPLGVGGWQFKSANWRLDGDLTSQVLKARQLLTVVPAKEEIEVAEVVPQVDPPLNRFVELTRTITVDDTSSVKTHGFARGLKAGEIIEIPLLKGEIPATRKYELKDDKILIVSNGPSITFAFDSTLSSKDLIELAAPDQADILENWQVACRNFYECQFSGVAEKKESGLYKTFEPNPGEKLQIKIEPRLLAVGNESEGQNWNLDVKAGPDKVTYRLEGQILLASMQTVSINIPAQAKVNSFVINEESSPIRPVDGQIVMQMGQGNNSFDLSYTVDNEESFKAVIDPFSTNLPLVNTKITYQHYSKRVVLATKGQVVHGTAISFWGYLLFYIILAFVLYSSCKKLLPDMPMKLYQWILLLAPLASAEFFLPIMVVIPLILLVLPLEARPKMRVFRFISLIFIVFLVGVSLIAAVGNALLSYPDMGLNNNVYSSYLGWFAGFLEAGTALPELVVYTIPLWCWKVLQFIWCMWLIWLAKGWYPLVADRFASALHHDKAKLGDNSSKTSDKK